MFFISTFAPNSELAERTNADISVTTEVTLLHICAAHANVAKDGTATASGNSVPHPGCAMSGSLTISISGTPARLMSSRL